MQSRYATPDNKRTTPKQLSKQAMHNRKKIHTYPPFYISRSILKFFKIVQYQNGFTRLPNSYQHFTREGGTGKNIYFSPLNFNIF